MKTKKPGDSIIVINYNNYHIKYRSLKDIDYRHIKMSKKRSINSVLPVESDVVLLGNDFTITKSFVRDLYKHYDNSVLGSLRVDSISSNKKFVESDFRIGSSITPDSFIHLALVFNTSTINLIGDTPKETAVMARAKNIPIDITPNIKVLQTNVKKKVSKNTGITVIIPSLDYKWKHIIKDVARPNDRIFEFSPDARTMTRFINQKISESHNDCILIINPESKISNVDMMNRIRGLYHPDKCLLFDTSDDISNNAWIVISKTRYSYSHKSFKDVLSLQQNIISYNSTIRYIERLERKTERLERKTDISNCRVIDREMISIIIPFMYNGDRWPLFTSCLKNLYHHTKDYDNIEIIVHETAPKRYITPKFIDDYELVYLYSKYDGIFHRAWNLNMSARHMATGGIFVFFDADLIIDSDWVNELLSCDKSIPYIGWGVLKNLNKYSTDIYLNNNEILTDSLERTRTPSATEAAAGINIIPRNMFFSIGGWPESYKDKGYGGEDNSLSYKMMLLGMYDGSQTAEGINS